MQAVLMHALQLRKSCREVFLLCDIQRHSVAEAAQILGIRRATANRTGERPKQSLLGEARAECAKQEGPGASRKAGEYRQR